MTDLSSRFTESIVRGQALDLSLEDPAEFPVAVDALCDLPCGPDLFRSLRQAASTDSLAAALDIVRKTSDPAVMIEIVRTLSRDGSEPEEFARALHAVFLERSEDRNAFWAVRAHALLGALFLSQQNRSLQRRLQSHLIDIDVQDDGDYLCHVAKVSGILLAHVDDDAVRERLEALLDVPEAEDEASLALGLLSLSKALGTPAREPALQGFRDAHTFLRRAVASSEERTDASLYLTCLDILLKFQDGEESGRLTDMVAGLRRQAFEYAGFLLPSDRPVDTSSWIGLASIEGLHWSQLGTRLACLDTNLLKQAWLDAARVIEEELVQIFSASRAILRRSREGGLEAVVQPRIVASLQRERAQLAALDQWLAENPENVASSVAATMRSKVSSALEASLLRNPTEAAGSSVTPAASIIAEGGLDEVAAAEARALLSEVILSFEIDRSDPFVLETWLRLRKEMMSNVDFAKNACARRLFELVLYHTIQFVSTREEMSRTATDGIEYLFNLSTEAPPVEADLQKDYFRHLKATPLGSLCRREEEGVGHGRADIRFSQNGIMTVAELKRTFEDMTLAELVQAYGLQATAYQRTNVTFCVLMVLDLIDRGGGSGHLRELAGIERKIPDGGTTEYRVAVFRVQGRKRSPSDIRSRS